MFFNFIQAPILKLTFLALSSWVEQVISSMS